MAYTYKNPVLYIGFNQARVLRWSRNDVRADSYDIEESGDMVVVIWNDKKMFEGWLKEHEVAIDQPERVRFYAIDSWGWMTRHIMNLSGSIRTKYNEAGSTLKTCGEIIKDILDNAGIPGWVCSGYSWGELSAMTVQPPMVDWEGIYVADAINEILRYQATFGAWIDPITKHMKFVNFEASLPQKAVYLGALNQSIIDHSEYNIVRTDLRPTLRGCLTKVIVEGDGISVTREDLSGCGTEANYTAERFIKDNNYVAGDESRMQTIADRVLAMNKDVKIEGEVVIDMGDTDVEWELGQEVAIKNSNKTEWDTRYLKIIGLTYDFQARQITIMLTNSRALFGDVFLRKNRVIDSKVDEIERDVESETALRIEQKTLLCEVTLKRWELWSPEGWGYRYNIRELHNIHNKYYAVRNLGGRFLEVGDNVSLLID